MHNHSILAEKQVGNREYDVDVNAHTGDIIYINSEIDD